MHAKNASLAYPNVIIRSPETDVFFIALNASSSISAQLFFETGNQNRRRIIAIEKMKQHLGSQLSAALLGFHSFTGIIITEKSARFAIRY